jgi:cysteine-rich repeat protein
MTAVSSMLIAIFPWASACRHTVPAELATDTSDGSTGTGTADAPAMSSTDADETGTTDSPNVETAGASSCGDGELQGDEGCDDGINDGAYGGCFPDCSAPAGHCGDGLVQPEGDETCDDADAIDGNGCNTDCRPSGMVVWEHEDVRYGTAYGVDVGSDGVIYAVGQAEGFVTSAWAGRLSDADGAVEWSYELPTPADAFPDNGFYAVTATSADHVMVGGRHDETGRLARLDGEGGLVETLPVPGVGGISHVALLSDGDFLIKAGWEAFRIDGFVEEWWTTVGMGLAYRADDDVALAAIPNAAGFRRFALHGEAFEPVTFPIPEGLTAEGRDVAWTSDGEVVVAGSVMSAGGEEALILRSTSGGQLRWVYGPEDLQGQYRRTYCLAVDSSDAIIVGGYTWLLGETRPFLMKLSPEGDVLWIRQLEFRANDAEIQGCTTTPTDEIVAVGHAGPYFWFAKLTP